MAVNKTCLSAGIVIRNMLENAEDVKKRVNKIFPVVTSDAKCPYIGYRRSGLVSEMTKKGIPADTTDMEVICYSADYEESIEIAEAVRAALEDKSYNDGTINMRSCRLVDSEEGWADDAYMQQLVFEIKI